jgi:hypothetical protein
MPFFFLALVAFIIATQTKSHRTRTTSAAACALLVLFGWINVSNPGGSTPSTSAARAPSVDRVRVSITSDPSGATVRVNGLTQGTTPLTVSVPVGRPTSYVVTAEEPYEDYALFKPFTGTLNVSEAENVSVWLERTTAAEQGAQRQEAEERRRAAAERLRAEEERRQRELEARKVYYRIETNCTRGANLTYSNVDGDTTQQSNQGNGWFYWMIPRSSQFLYLSAQNQCDYGYITVKLVKDGVTLKDNTSTGAYVIATVSGRW